MWITAVITIAWYGLIIGVLWVEGGGTLVGLFCSLFVVLAAIIKLATHFGD